MFWFSFDAMGEFAFGNDFGMLRKRAYVPILHRQQRALAMLAPVAGASWASHFGMTFLPFLSQIRDFHRLCQFCDGRMAERIKVTCSLLLSSA
jgi:hypothetical protein